MAQEKKGRYLFNIFLDANFVYATETLLPCLELTPESCIEVLAPADRKRLSVVRVKSSPQISLSSSALLKLHLHQTR